MDDRKRLELIKRNTEEIVNEDKIKKFLKKGVVYCGYEVSGEIHLGHMVTILKLLDLQKAGIKVKVLLADWHTWLNKKGDWDFVNKQMKQWEKGFKSIGLKAQIVKGSHFQTRKDYIEDILKLALKVTVNRGVRSMQQVARDIENAKISQIIYPLMQVVDVKELGVNFVVAGLDQRKVYMLGVDEGKEIGLQDAVYLSTPMIPGLKGPGEDMAQSETEKFLNPIKPLEVFGEYKLELYEIDNPEKRKIKGALASMTVFQEAIHGKEDQTEFKIRLKDLDSGEVLMKDSIKLGKQKFFGNYLFIDLDKIDEEGNLILNITKLKRQKMSSSVKESFISIRDKKQDIRKKIVGAYCKVGDIKNNPILSIVRLIIFPKFEKILIKRDKKYGGDIEFKDHSSLEGAFETGKLHALDLKNAVADYLEKIIAPIRKGWK